MQIIEFWAYGLRDAIGPIRGRIVLVCLLEIERLEARWVGAMTARAPPFASGVPGPSGRVRWRRVVSGRLGCQEPDFAAEEGHRHFRRAGRHPMPSQRVPATCRAFAASAGHVRAV